MRQWRILHSESSLGWGGQERRVFAELEWMRAQGHWVALAAHPSAGIARNAQAAGIRFLRLHTHKAMLPLEVLRLAAWLWWHRVDFVNSHSSNDGWTAGLACAIARLFRWRGRCRWPVLIRSRHIEVDYPNRFWSRIAYRVLPQYVITTSKRIAERLKDELGVCPARIGCIPSGVDLGRFHPGVTGTLRTELKLTGDVPLIGVVAVLRSWKGHATFLDAAALLLGRRRAHFIIAGEGPGRDDLAARIALPPWKDHVTLVGYRTDVPEVLASLDVLVLPSYAHEGIPQIILQGQAMARAIIGTTVGGIPEVVEDGVTGLLVPPLIAAALAEKMELLLEKPDLARQLGQQAYVEAVAHHSLDVMGRQLLELYQQLEAERDPRSRTGDRTNEGAARSQLDSNQRPML